MTFHFTYKPLNHLLETLVCPSPSLSQRLLLLRSTEIHGFYCPMCAPSVVKPSCSNPHRYRITSLATIESGPRVQSVDTRKKGGVVGARLRAGVRFENSSVCVSTSRLLHKPDLNNEALRSVDWGPAEGGFPIPMRQNVEAQRAAIRHVSSHGFEPRPHDTHKRRLLREIAAEGETENHGFVVKPIRERHTVEEWSEIWKTITKRNSSSHSPAGMK